MLWQLLAFYRPSTDLLPPLTSPRSPRPASQAVYRALVPLNAPLVEVLPFRPRVSSTGMYEFARTLVSADDFTSGGGNGGGSGGGSGARDSGDLSGTAARHAQITKQCVAGVILLHEVLSEGTPSVWSSAAGRARFRALFARARETAEYAFSTRACA